MVMCEELVCYQNDKAAFVGLGKLNNTCLFSDKQTYAAE